MSESAVVQCAKGTVQLQPDGYVLIHQIPGAEQTWDSAVEMLEAAASLVPEGELAAVVVVAPQSRTTREARRAFAEVGGRLISCVALLVDSRISEVTGNFFMRLNQPSYPMRLFRSHEEAALWVLPHVGKPRV